MNCPGRKLSLLISVLLFNQHLFAQGYMKGDAIVSISVGVPHLYKALEGYNIRSEAFKKNFKGDVEVVSIKGVNPISLKYEYAFTENFGIGISVSWWIILVNVNDVYYVNNNTLRQTDNYDVKIKSTSLGIRPNYHIHLNNKKSDLFFGCSVGLTKNRLTANFSTTYGSNTSPFQYAYYEQGAPIGLYFAPTFGYRHYIATNMALNFEAGFEKGALLQAGIVYRFRPFKYEKPT